ncbi:MAG: hypothetical protein ACYDBH_18255 [Acidobacteriaceae bacterium]
MRRVTERRSGATRDGRSEPLPAYALFGASTAPAWHGGISGVGLGGHLRRVMSFVIIEPLRVFPKPRHHILDHVEPAFGVGWQDPRGYGPILQAALGERAPGKSQILLQSVVAPEDVREWHIRIPCDGGIQIIGSLGNASIGLARQHEFAWTSSRHRVGADLAHVHATDLFS